MLHLVLAGRLPEHELNITAANAITYFKDSTEKYKEYFDAVIANPPFIPLGTQSPEMRVLLSDYMADFASGRIDAYLAFLRIALETLKPGGLGLFVLPHNFLLGENAKKMRQAIHESCWIRCLADLSAIRVFRETGSYVILLIFQKMAEANQRAPNATIIKCQDRVGQALQDALEGRILENNQYSIYELDQSFFESHEWLVVPPAESSLKNRLKTLPVISDYLNIGLGFISGADHVFIVPSHKIPKGERALYKPFVPDREISRYQIHQKIKSYFIYPFLQNTKLDEAILRQEFPITWQYLTSHEEELQKRSQVKKGNIRWWEPERPRSYLMSPKIISPHLVITPRFSLDIEGQYAVSHGPIFYPRDVHESDLLYYFVAVLNSTPCFWFIHTCSHKYSHGYSKLEVKTLKSTPVPDPANIPSSAMIEIIDLVKRRGMATNDLDAFQIEKKLNDIITNLYGLTEQELRALGMD